ncbi:carboxymuconolactone decarboxylase family protein [Planomonospora sp. ID91781]|uniref:Alkylhydroperoxidase n=1 Tax=Planomonospora sphaerica TaxID=161355 RepID=A0A161LPA7_9ACTN|nr:MULTISPECIES: carboxymuconolactone decarboxylase family protein [Planomonospora]MBG0820228.1 carboxymuconolactone decarboxylase family protein [Planomonospora sp. ID91781]GAT67946.1 alkylhydroperoxidase [Planomonospora sphaerica]GGL36998.1 alkyl hydroperoxide reductase AhpD [Planomonospora parontospora subsp. antibiotica]GII17290.1 alkyl hydroperoxide reductase AhpD [Planomonospora parontospora subsp. antibiotica]
MKARMNVGELAPEAYKAMLGLEGFLRTSTLPHATLELVKLRASQINGCGFCVDMHAHEAKKAGESDERLFSVAAWREAPYFTDAERAALALAEEATRLADRGEAVPDAVWEEAARHHDEKTLAALVVAIATINAWNRICVTTRQIAGSYRQG